MQPSEPTTAIYMHFLGSTSAAYIQPLVPIFTTYMQPSRIRSTLVVNTIFGAHNQYVYMPQSITKPAFATNGIQ